MHFLLDVAVQFVKQLLNERKDCVTPGCTRKREGASEYCKECGEAGGEIGCAIIIAVIIGVCIWIYVNNPYIGLATAIGVVILLVGILKIKDSRLFRKLATLIGTSSKWSGVRSFVIGVFWLAVLVSITIAIFNA